MTRHVPNMYLSTSHESHNAKAPLRSPPRAMMVDLAAHHAIAKKHSEFFPKLSGHGAAYPRVPDEDNQRVFETTTHSHYGGPFAADESKRTHSSLAATNARNAAIDNDSMGPLSTAHSLRALASTRRSSRNSSQTLRGDFAATATAPAPALADATAVAEATAATVTAAASPLAASASASNLYRSQKQFASPLATTATQRSVRSQNQLLAYLPRADVAAVATQTVGGADSVPLPPSAGLSNAQRADRNARGSGPKSYGSTGERLRVENTDPKEHTFIQRAWINNKDLYLSYVRQQPDPRSQLPAIPGHGLVLSSMLNPGGVPQRASFAKRNDPRSQYNGVWSG